jgi:HSP20 family protein
MRMSPFQMMQAFTEEMDRMFEDFGGGMTAGGRQGGALQRRGGQGLFGGAGFAPHVEVFQREGDLVVRADLPGLSPEDVNVEVTDDGLLIEGERRSEQSGEEGGLYHSEVSYGSFSRLIPLPECVDAENARADFNNGVLEITMRAPQQQPQQNRRRIEVRGTGQQQQSGGESTAHTKSRGKAA